MTVNLTAYAIEIVRAGIESVPPGQREAGLALGISPAMVFFYIVLPQAIANVYPALVSQIVITMLESAVVSQIAVTDLTHVADFIQSRTYRAFETYFVITLIYLAMAISLRWLFARAGRRLFAGRAAMIRLSLADIVPFLLLAARWTLLLVGHRLRRRNGRRPAPAAPALCLGRRSAARIVHLYIELLQGTPLLLQLFLVFFGLPLLGIEVSPLLAAGVALTLYASAFLAEIWRGCVDAIPRGQWDASASLGMKFLTQMRYVILPQALHIAVPPTVGFLVQLVKSTALASIVGFNELTRAGQIVANATFQPFPIYGLVAIIYFAMCYPLTLSARMLERRLARSRG